ncbi:MAG TPA: DNA polymerase III subunit delta' C-terminal domain-containing protein [Pyrinomonadaceae bacterium]|nr:DNA polymerase III subunit delta' C-terminal domain-containing protein [Pyrinomonadaceae bacterium]
MFNGLIGNADVVKLIRRLAASGRMPNAMVFAGPDGVGKRQFAFEIGRMFACRQPIDIEACGRCPACERIGPIELPEPIDRNKGRFEKVFFGEHGDVGFVAAYRRFILVDAIRDLEAQGRFRPFEGRARLFIIDEADKMNEAASNALLKTLEEPAPTTHICLITSRPERLLPTIRSRCQIVRFAPVPVAEIEQMLVETQGSSTPDAVLAARLSGGSVGRAFAMDLGEFRARRERLLAVLMNATGQPNFVEVLRISEELTDAKNKDRFESNLDILESLVRDIWVVRSGGSPDLIVNADVVEVLTEFSSKASSAELAGWLEDIQELRKQMAVNVNLKIATDALLVRMAA